MPELFVHNLLNSHDQILPAPVATPNDNNPGRTGTNSATATGTQPRVGTQLTPLIPSMNVNVSAPPFNYIPSPFNSGNDANTPTVSPYSGNKANLNATLNVSPGIVDIRGDGNKHINNSDSDNINSGIAQAAMNTNTNVNENVAVVLDTSNNVNTEGDASTERFLSVVSGADITGKVPGYTSNIKYSGKTVTLAPRQNRYSNPHLRHFVGTNPGTHVIQPHGKRVSKPEGFVAGRLEHLNSDTLANSNLLNVTTNANFNSVACTPSRNSATCKKAYPNITPQGPFVLSNLQSSPFHIPGSNPNSSPKKYTPLNSPGVVQPVSTAATICASTRNNASISAQNNNNDEFNNHSSPLEYFNYMNKAYPSQSSTLHSQQQQYQRQPVYQHAAVQPLQVIASKYSSPQKNYNNRSSNIYNYSNVSGQQLWSNRLTSALRAAAGTTIDTTLGTAPTSPEATYSYAQTNPYQYTGMTTPTAVAGLPFTASFTDGNIAENTNNKNIGSNINANQNSSGQRGTGEPVYNVGNNSDNTGTGNSKDFGGKGSYKVSSTGSRGGNGNGDPSQNNNNNNNNNNNGSTGGQSSNNGSNKSSQALVQKLQDIYKLIVKQEIELQERCSQLTVSQTTNIKSLWAVYNVNTELINNYTIFITTALLPSQSPQDLLIGEEIIEIYRIERRLWVYGTITFLDVLKNFSNFMDPEVCSQFISHVFISLSTMLIDLPQKHSIPWLQRLGDLSRMAIALYPAGFIDWKLSAEYWYNEAMKFIYGHGKLYYHMSTVQQNTLEAFVNLGKSVFCQDTFTPSQQYMQLVIDNIYQRTFIDRTNNGNIRNTDLIDYLKHSEVMLLPNFQENKDLQQVVLSYFQDRFGIDFNDNDIFDTRLSFCQTPTTLRFFFRHAPAFAESHILQLVGFGNPKNPFALLFDLAKYLKERKDKKEKNKAKQNQGQDMNQDQEQAQIQNNVSTRSTVSADTNTINSMEINSITESNLDGSDNKSVCMDVTTVDDFFTNIETLAQPTSKPNVYIWLKSLSFINLTSLRCSMIVLKKFLHGPFVVALPHFLPWTYFILATLIKLQRDFQDDTDSYQFWKALLGKIFPWNTITKFLNVLLAYVLDNYSQNKIIERLCQEYSRFGSLDELVDYFNEHEELPEVWKCWGTLWFDVICDKAKLNADNLEDLGISDHFFLDFPIDGIDFDKNDETGEKFWKRCLRTIFLFKGMAENFDIDLKTTTNIGVYCRGESCGIDPRHFLRSFCFKLVIFKDNSFPDIIPVFEGIDDVNTDFNAVPPLSVINNESIFDYIGYKKFCPTTESFDKNGDVISSSLYTSWTSNGSMGNSGGPGSLGGANGGIMSNPRSQSNSALGVTGASTATTGGGGGTGEYIPAGTILSGAVIPPTSVNNSILSTVNNGLIIDPISTNSFNGGNSEEVLRNRYLNPTFALDYDPLHPHSDIFRSYDEDVNRDLTYFVFDATSWLRHFSHIYKLAVNKVLKFAVCLTTFQELRFLRRSKDENVVEAAARAIITMRQLYSESKLLPLRFTGNVANDIEEHLEVEEQITWRSHVDEFVIEAVVKAQAKFREANMENGTPTVPDFNFVVLVTDDANMSRKAQEQNIRTFSTHFIFSVCNKMGLEENICTN